MRSIVCVSLWDRHKHVAELRRVMGSQSSPMYNLHFQQQYRYKQTLQKTADLLPFKKTTHNYKNEQQHGQ